MKFSRRSRTGVFSAALIALTLSAPAHSVVIDSFFGMNFVGAGGPAAGGQFELNLLNITYAGGGGATYTTAMPVFSGNMLDNPSGPPRTGLPDYSGLVAAPTYTTLPFVGVEPTGDGETTRTIGETVPINWDTSGGFPIIGISSITAEVSALPGALWELTFPSDAPYKVGLIPPGATNELDSLLFAPFGDIYDGLAGVSGNPVGTAVVSVAPPGFESWIGTASGDFIFAAAAVPLPAAVWLFGSGLLGLIGIARRKKAA